MSGNDVDTVMSAADGKTSGWALGDEGSIGDWVPGEGGVSGTSSDLDIGVAKIWNERLGAKAVHLVGSVGASDFSKNLIEKRGWNGAIVIVLWWRVWRGCDGRFEKRWRGVASVGHNVVHDRSSSSRVSKESDLVFVSSKLVNVVSDPLKSKLLIEKTLKELARGTRVNPSSIYLPTFKSPSILTS